MSDSSPTPAAPGGASPIGARVVALGAALYALPIALLPLVPGSDTPWHAAIVAALESGDPARFLGYLEIEPSWGSYAIVYRPLAALAALVGSVWALKLLAMAAIAGTVGATAALLRAYRREPALALLAGPAAYSVTFEFGFFVFWLAVPIGIAAWAVAAAAVARARPVRALAGLSVVSIAVGLIHPFAAVVVFAGGAAIALAERAPGTRRLAVLAALALALVPAAASLRSLGDAGETAAWVPGHLSLADKLALQQFSGALESVVAAPARLFGFVPDSARFAIFVASLGAVLLLRRRAAPREGECTRGPRTLLAVAVAVYLLCPFSFLWPRVLHAAQPRLLPWVWVALLLALAPRALGDRRAAAASAGVAASALAVLWLTFLGPYRTEAGDLLLLVDRIPERQRVLPLIEQRPAVATEPPSSMRNAGAWVLARRGGFVPYLPFAESTAGLNAGTHLPVRLAGDAPESPAAPFQGFPRRFRGSLHAPGWSYFLIRDAGNAVDYFRDRPGAEEVARRGRWRLVRARTTTTD